VLDVKFATPKNYLMGRDPSTSVVRNAGGMWGDHEKSEVAQFRICQAGGKGRSLCGHSHQKVVIAREADLSAAARKTKNAQLMLKTCKKGPSGSII